MLAYWIPRALGALEVSMAGSGLLKVAAMERPSERPKLEAGRLVGLSPVSKRDQRPQLGLEQ